MSTTIVIQSICIVIQCIMIGVNSWGIRWTTGLYQKWHDRRFLLIRWVMRGLIVFGCVMIGVSIAVIARAVA